jgi:Domain of unknown function (DUF4274)
MSFSTENARMIDWLNGQPPMTTHAIADSLNWDFSEEAILWIASQHTTDEATASVLFLRSCVSNYFPKIDESGALRPYESGGLEVIHAISNKRSLALAKLGGDIGTVHGRTQNRVAFDRIR